MFFLQLDIISILAVISPFLTYKINALEFRIESSQSLPLRRTNRILKDEWRDFEALENCPDLLLVESNLNRRELAEITYTQFYDWSMEKELLEGSLTRDELRSRLGFDDLPIDIQGEFLGYACIYDDDCNGIVDIVDANRVFIPLADLESQDAELVATSLCSEIALKFDTLFNLVKTHADQIPTSLPSVQPSLAPASPTLIPTLSPSEPPLKVTSQKPSTTISSSASPTINLAGPESSVNLNSQFIVFSFRFDVRASGRDLVHSQLVALSNDIEKEIERKTIIALEGSNSNRRRLHQKDHTTPRQLASFVHTTVRSLEKIECDPPQTDGTEVTCLRVNADITVNTEDENPLNVVEQVQKGLIEGEQVGAFFTNLPGLEGFENAQPTTVDAIEDIAENQSKRTTRLVIIFTSVFGGILFLILMFNFTKSLRNRATIRQVPYLPKYTTTERTYVEKKEDDEDSDGDKDYDKDRDEANENSIVDDDIAAFVYYEGKEQKPPSQTTLPLETTTVNAISEKEDLHAVHLNTGKNSPGQISTRNLSSSISTNHHSLNVVTPSGTSPFQDSLKSYEVSTATQTLSAGDSSSESEEELYSASTSEQVSKGSSLISEQSRSNALKNQVFLQESVKTVFDVFCNPQTFEPQPDDIPLEEKSITPPQPIAQQSSPAPTDKCEEDIEIVLETPEKNENESSKADLGATVLKVSDLASFSDASSDFTEEKGWIRKLGIKRTVSVESTKLLKNKIKSDTVTDKKSVWNIARKKSSESYSGIDDVDKEYEGDNDADSSIADAVSPLSDYCAFETPPKVKRCLWKSALDEKSGDTYYYHTVTNETSWKKPDSFDEDDEDEDDDSFPGLNAIPVSKSSNFAVKLSKADVEEEVNDPKKRQIRELLEKLSPNEKESNLALINQYAGREDELILQLNELVGDAPFDEPSVVSLDSLDKKSERNNIAKKTNIPESISPSRSSTSQKSSSTGFIPSPMRHQYQMAQGPFLQGRIQTASSIGLLSRQSKLSHATQKRSNVTGMKPQTQSGLLSTDEESISSIDSKEADFSRRGETLELPRVDEIFEESYPRATHRKRRDLTAEVFEKYNRSNGDDRAVRRSRRTRGSQKIRSNPSFEQSSVSENEGRSDASTVSELSDPGFTQDSDRYRGRAKVRLRKAIKNKDWERASSVAASLRSGGDANSYSDMSSQKSGQQNGPPEVWSQSELDQRIAENDWDSVFRYVNAVNKGKNVGRTRSNVYPRKRFEGHSQRKYIEHSTRPSMSKSFSEDDGNTSDDNYVTMRRRRSV